MIRAAFLVFSLNALLFFPVLYQSYKHYDPGLTPWDVGAYMSMVEDPGGFEPPFRYRLLAPLIVKSMRVLPGYGIEVDFTDDPVVKKDFFHFSLLNFLITVLTSALLFAHLRKRGIEPGFAYLGSLLYLFSFYSIVTNIIPMGDTSCHLAIMTAILLFESRKPFWFALACLVGAFSKETLLIVMGLWIALQGWTERRRLLYLLYMLPGVFAYIAATRIWPGPPVSEFDYYRPGFLLQRVTNIFHPGEYNSSFIFHVYLAQAPLMIALMLWIWLKVRGRGQGLGINRELLVFPFLIWLGMTMNIGNSVGRVAFMAFPAMILFQVLVIREFMKNAPSLRQG